MLVERWLTTSVEGRESALISRRYGVPGSFILLLNWKWCSYRLEMGVSGNLWIVVKNASHLLYMMWNARWLWIQWRGIVLHLELIWGTPIYFALLRWHQCSSLVLTVFLGILFGSIREIHVPYIFEWKTELLSMKCRGIGPHHAARGKSHEFSRVAADTWCIFSSYGGDGHLKFGFVQRSQDSCLVKTDTSGS